MPYALVSLGARRHCCQYNVHISRIDLMFCTFACTQLNFLSIFNQWPYTTTQNGSDVDGGQMCIA